MRNKIFLLLLYASFSLQQEEDNLLLEPIESNELIPRPLSPLLDARKLFEEQKFFRLFGKEYQTKWLVIAGRKVYPSSIYRVAVELLKKKVRDENIPLTVHASLTKDDTQVATGRTYIEPGQLAEILLYVPDESISGHWFLSVEGRESSSNIVVFRNTTELIFYPDFLTILIQTSRPVYNAGQIVRFRAILLTNELVAYEEPVDVFVFDPNGKVMRRWPSRQTGEGLTLSFKLPAYPLLGNWTIEVKARGQKENKTIIVEQYFKPRFEVFVRLPHQFKLSDEYISGVIVANMTNYREVFGNCTIRLEFAQNDDFPVPTRWSNVTEFFFQNFTGIQPFHLPMYLLEGRGVGSLDGKIIKIHASVGDAFGWQIEHGFAMAKLYEERVQVSILGDQPIFFQPGMPLTIHVFVSYSDGHPLDEDQYENALLTVVFSSSKTETFYINGTTLMEGEGVTPVTFSMPEDATSLTISARFSGTNGLTGGDSATGMRHHSNNNHFLQIETSSDDVKIGEFIVLHVRNNFFVSYFNYAVIGKGLMVHSGREDVFDRSYPSVTTFTLPASVEMAPVAKILIWVVDNEGSVISNSISIPINPLSKHEVGVRWNEHKDHSGGSFEAKLLGETGAFFATTSLWEETYHMNTDCDITESRVILHMLGLMDNSRIDYSNVTVPNVRLAATRARRGAPTKIRIFPTTNTGPDALITFNFSEVMLLTNAKINHYPGRLIGDGICEDGFFMCLTGGCYRREQRCDGVPDCTDLSDEAGCPVRVDRGKMFRMYRLSRLWRFYDPDDGDYAWRDVRAYGNEVQVFGVPKIPQNWVFSMFAVGKYTGLGIMNDVVAFDSAGPFMLTVDAPPVARMWEQVGLTVGVFNYHVTQVGVLITLEKSDKYKNIFVEKNSVVDSYNPRTFSGTFQHVVWLPPSIDHTKPQSVDVHIPIVFTEMGKIEITIVGSTQMMTDSQTVVIDVQPEGAKIGKHTSILLDLKDRAIVYEFFNIHLDETPIIPYTIDRRYLFGTPVGHVSVTGDIVGPSFPEIPINSNNMLGFEVMGAETSAYNFAANIYSLHYLRLTNQETDDIRFKVLEAVNEELAALVRYQGNDGGFSNWIGSEQSVWLTAYAIKALWTANFQEWEDFIYIDPEIARKGIGWLLQYQTEFGSFHETDYYLDPLNAKIEPRSRHSWMPKYQNTTLTAHVVIAITESMKALQGDIYRDAILAKERAILYLERLIEVLDDPYDVAVVTWALTKANSDVKELAFSKLDTLKIQAGDIVYWSREPVGFHPIIYEDSQRPYLNPKDDQKWDAHSVETSSFALLTYIEREGIGILQENIVRFLAVMRELDGGLISTVDSLAAMEALVQYAFRARIRDVTNMRVAIELAAEPGRQIMVELKDDNTLSKMRSFDLNNLWGHLNIKGKGSGQALVQLDYSYGVDIPEELDVPPVPSFEFDLDARYSGRNNSYVSITSCQKWINVNETKTSGMAVVDIHMPSGYYIMQDKLIDMVLAKRVKHLRWALRTDTSVKFFFNRIENERTCFSYTLERWFPVSNHSRHNLAMVYDMYQPERFQMKLFEVFPLYVLDICEVCGSYQCSYCPYYSTAAKHFETTVYFIPVILVTIYMQNILRNFDIR